MLGRERVNVNLCFQHSIYCRLKKNIQNKRGYFGKEIINEIGNTKRIL